MVCSITVADHLRFGRPMKPIRNIRHDTRGATAIEYALIAALVVLAAVGGFTVLGSSSNGLWANVNANVASKL